ncbi:hypothetical protein GQX73_g2271 [Xylaria multiplex]|uniref:Heterokaryon incompatibility domain-containing protein n=1 Tax=Xylaria multiplex TaxID=323545 RepID=A0A7C8ISL9_9PEZI|nr:hypothetical protein GQX73_g2271 [Xylaria multiplex]
MELTCSACIKLRDGFSSLEDNYAADLSLLSTILDEPCPSHNALFRYIKAQLTTKDTEIYLFRVSANHPLEILFEDGSGGIRRMEFVVTKARDGSRSFRRWASCHGRIFDPHWIDVGLVKSWIERCATLHGNTCAEPFRIVRVSPDWLIDTLDACVVPGRGITDYVAMSYRWGASKGFQIGAEFEVIRKPGALFEKNVTDKIPLSISHTIQLVRSLGERYLWIDALCIDQSDKVHFGRQIEMMGAIYASAKLTVVATDGDANTGIKGLRGVSQSRDLESVVLPLFENSTIIRTETIRNYDNKTNNDGYIKGTPEYFQRGWTHQEFHLSKRRLMFYGERVFWQCTCADWYEDLIETERLPSKWWSPFSSSVMLKGVPDLLELNLALRGYAKREHSYAEDSLPGITGLLSILSRSFEGGFLCGLPEACFDATLMWTAEGGCRRRVNSGRNHSALISPLPSWSWVGWQIDWLSIAPGEALSIMGAGNRRRTTPITQWFTHESPNSGLKRPIRTTWFNFHRLLKVELVAICLQRREERSELRYGKWYDAYGVFWIKWIDGVAYREGQGYVFKDMWDSHDLGDVDLVLG